MVGLVASTFFLIECSSQLFASSAPALECCEASQCSFGLLAPSGKVLRSVRWRMRQRFYWSSMAWFGGPGSVARRPCIPIHTNFRRPTATSALRVAARHGDALHCPRVRAAAEHMISRQTMQVDPCGASWVCDSYLTRTGPSRLRKRSTEQLRELVCSACDAVFRKLVDCSLSQGRGRCASRDTALCRVLAVLHTTGVASRGCDQVQPPQPDSLCTFDLM